MIRLHHSIRRFFMNNIFLKLGSFILAIILWFIVQIQGKIEQKVDLKITTASFHNLPDDGVVQVFKKSSDALDVISVRMKGIPSAMSKIAQQASISIDLPNNFSDWGREIVFEITNKNIHNIPFGVEILNINPTTIAIMLDYFVKKEVPVMNEYVGVPPDGFKVESFSVRPERVIISGPRSVIETKPTVMTRYNNISLLEISPYQQIYTFKDTPLIVPNFINCDPPQVELIFEIREIMETFELKNVAMEIKRLEGTDTYEEIEPERVDVLIEGPINIIKSFDRKSLRIILDVQELPPDKWRDVAPKAEFAKDLASRFRVKSFSPPKIAVRISKRNSQNREP